MSTSPLRDPGPALRQIASEVADAYNQAHQSTGAKPAECVVAISSARARMLRAELSERGVSFVESGGLRIQVLGIDVHEEPWLADGPCILRRKAGVRGGLPL